jgi:hypothetical protein
MSIFELQKERNKQLSQPKIKETEQAYKPISETYNIVDYYNMMRNGKYEQMTQSKAKIPNQQLSYFSENLKSKELAKTGHHNLNLYSLLSDRAKQLQGYNKPQVYEEKISSGSDSKISDELDQLLNSFVDKIQSGVFDITMSNDIYRIFKIFETSSYLFTTELLEKYSEYVKDIISVFEEDSTRELIKRDFKGSNILQLLLVLTEKIEEMIETMIKANQEGKNNVEKQIILRNYVKSKNLKKPDMKYIKIINAEYKLIDKKLETARKERNQTLINALTIKIDDLKRVLPVSPSIEPITMRPFEDETEAVAMPSVAMPSVDETVEPAIIPISEPTDIMPSVSEPVREAVEELDPETRSRMEDENARTQIELSRINERIQQMIDAFNENDGTILRLEEETRKNMVDLVDLKRIPTEERTTLENSQLRELTLANIANEKELRKLKSKNETLDAQIDALRETRDTFYSRITALEDFIRDLSKVASKSTSDVKEKNKKPSKKIKPAKPIREKNPDEYYIFFQSFEDVKKPPFEILKPVGNNIISKSPEYSYPREEEKFIQKVEKDKMFALLKNLNIDTGTVSMPRSDLLTVRAMYGHFLSSNPNLTTSTGQPWFY